jgi:capsule polysaccharide export protein KpsE/RkpR
MSETKQTGEQMVQHREAIVPARPESVLVYEESEKVARARRVAKQRVVWVNRQVVLRAAIIGIVASTAIAFLIPQRFESTARLMPPDQSNASGMGMALLAATSGSAGAGSPLGSSLGSMAGDLLGVKNSSDLFVGILQSHTVQDDLINKFNLRKVYWDRRIEDARKDLDSHTTLTADRKSGIILIQVTDKSRERAVQMADEYISQLNFIVTNLKTSSAHRERVFLEDRLVQVKQDLENSEKDFSGFASKNTALDIPAQGKAMIEAAAAMEGQLIVAQTELEGLKQIYADGNVRVRAAQARVDELQHQLEKNVGGKPGDLPIEGGQAPSPLYPSIRQLPVLGVSYADLYRNMKVQEAVFQMLTQQYELAKVQEAKETPSVKVLDPPDVPEKRSFPPRLLIIVLGTMLAVAGNVMWLFGKESWDQTERDDPQKVFAEEVFHTVRAYTPWAINNGASGNGNGHKMWGRFRRNRQQLENEK